jgi:hypothetical protein
MTLRVVSELKLNCSGERFWNFVSCALMSMGLCRSIVARFSAIDAACAAGSPDKKRAETSDANGNNRNNDLFITGTPYKDNF